MVARLMIIVHWCRSNACTMYSIESTVEFPKGIQFQYDHFKL